MASCFTFWHTESLIRLINIKLLTHLKNELCTNLKDNYRFSSHTIIFENNVEKLAILTITQKKHKKWPQERLYLPIERIPLTCLTSLNSPTTFFSASTLCSSFMGAVLPPTTSATCATKPLSTCTQLLCHPKLNI